MLFRTNNNSKTYRDGQIILHQGHFGESMGLVEQGRVEVFHKTDDGEETVYRVIGAHGVFGIDSLFSGRPRSSGIRAVGRVRVAIMNRRDFIRRSQSDPGLAFSVLRLICHRLREATDALETSSARKTVDRPSPIETNSIQ